MKIYKIILALFLVVFLTACQKEYNLFVEDDKITEEFNIIVPDNDENNERLRLNYYPLHANDDVFYEKRFIKENKNINATFKYSYEPIEFVNANSINQCFDSKEILVDNEDYYYFKLEKLRDCMTDYNININIITDNKVLSNNANKVSGNKYTWYLTNNNKDTFNLEIKIAKGKKNNDIDIKYIIIISTVVILLIIFLAYFLHKKQKSNNI